MKVSDVVPSLRNQTRLRLEASEMVQATVTYSPALWQLRKAAEEECLLLFKV